MASVNLDVDEAYLNVTTSYPTNSVWMYYMTAECYKCPFERLAEIRSLVRSGEKNTFFVSTKFHNMWRFYRKNMGKYVAEEEHRNMVCEMDPPLDEFGVYDFMVGANGKCDVNVVRPPINSNLALLWFFLIILAVFLIIRGLCCLKAKWHAEESFEVNERGSSSSGGDYGQPTKKHRLLSIDTFRGICVILMVFVNSGGGSYWWIGHSEWNGATMPDFIFPSFLWIMGFCIPLSLSSKLAKKEPKAKIILEILKRSLILFIIGICESYIGEIHLEKIQIRGVIQRFALAYLVVGTIYILILSARQNRRMMENYLGNSSSLSQTDSSMESSTSSSSAVPPPCADILDDRLPTMYGAEGPSAAISFNKKPRYVLSFLYDFVVLWPLWILVFILIAVHLCTLFNLQVPGCPPGYMGPGGKQYMGKYGHCMGGAVGYIDWLVLGNETSTNINNNNGITAVYEAIPLNPFNLFGNLLTIVQVFFGLHCGVIFMLWKAPKSRIFRLAFWAIATGIAAGLLCGFTRDSGLIPINQTMWSLSYTFASNFIAIACFLVCYVLVDVCCVWSGKPFIYPGMNSMLIFVGHEAIGEMLPFHWKLSKMNSHFIVLLENGWTTLVWLGISYFLYKCNIFINP